MSETLTISDFCATNGVKLKTAQMFLKRRDVPVHNGTPLTKEQMQILCGKYVPGTKEHEVTKNAVQTRNNVAEHFAATRNAEREQRNMEREQERQREREQVAEQERRQAHELEQTRERGRQRERELEQQIELGRQRALEQERELERERELEKERQKKMQLKQERRRLAFSELDLINYISALGGIYSTWKVASYTGVILFLPFFLFYIYSVRAVKKMDLKDTASGAIVWAAFLEILFGFVNFTAIRTVLDKVEHLPGTPTICAAVVSIFIIINAIASLATRWSETDEMSKKVAE